VADLVRTTWNKWPRALSELKTRAKQTGYHYFENGPYHGSRLGDRLYNGRVFLESETNPYAEDDDKVRITMVKLVEQSEQWGWSITSMGLPGDQILEIGDGSRVVLASPGTANSWALRLAALVERGLVPDKLEYGQNTALARWMGVAVPAGTSSDGWVIEGDLSGEVRLVRR
jgi:hypothetical protein